MGLRTYYKWFTYGFADTAKQLIKLTGETQDFRWCPEVEVAFQLLKNTLCATPILGYPKQGEKFIADTGMSNDEIGGVLLHVQDGQKWVTAYHNKMLNKANRNYCITQWEILAIMRRLEHFWRKGH
jgi:hypothetical protein